jgi:hypothetical protein
MKVAALAGDFADDMVEALGELRDLIAECQAMREAFREERRACQEERRAIIQIVREHADIATLTAILAHLERAAWQGWPVRGHA